MSAEVTRTRNVPGRLLAFRRVLREQGEGLLLTQPPPRCLWTVLLVEGRKPTLARRPDLLAWLRNLTHPTALAAADAVEEAAHDFPDRIALCGVAATGEVILHWITEGGPRR